MSPGMSVMHFSQKVYLSENKLGVGFLNHGGLVSPCKTIIGDSLTCSPSRSTSRPSRWCTAVGRSSRGSGGKWLVSRVGFWLFSFSLVFSLVGWEMVGFWLFSFLLVVWLVGFQIALHLKWAGLKMLVMNGALQWELSFWSGTAVLSAILSKGFVLIEPA